MRLSVGNIRTRILLTSAVIAALAAFYFIFDPLQTRWLPKCPFYIFTGLECPGCGSQRVIHALAHGDIAAAWSANAFFVCLLPVLAVMAWASIFREKYQRLYMTLNSVPVIAVIGIAIVAWGILRNCF